MGAGEESGHREGEVRGRGGGRGGVQWPAGREGDPGGVGLRRRRVVIDDVGVDAEVPQRAALEVCELPVVVHHDDSGH